MCAHAHLGVNGLTQRHPICIKYLKCVHAHVVQLLKVRYLSSESIILTRRLVKKHKRHANCSMPVTSKV